MAQPILQPVRADEVPGESPGDIAVQARELLCANLVNVRVWDGPMGDYPNPRNIALDLDDGSSLIVSLPKVEDRVVIASAKWEVADDAGVG